MKMKKAISLLLALMMILCTISACKNSDTPGTSGAPATGGGTPGGETQPGGEPVPEAKPFWQSMDPNTSGTLDIMCWSGDGIYHEDLGHENLKPEDITAQNVAAIYALAKKFNEFYPNVKINLYSKPDDPNANDTTWTQELENFKAEHGKYPDVYAANDLLNDTARGLVADLSVYKDDPLYKTFNPSIMATMNYYGFQAGLPQFTQPWGVWVNKQLAEDNNIDVPDPDWDLDDFTDFITKADNKTFWGTMDFAQLITFIGTGTTTVSAQMAKYSGEGDRVNIASDEVMDLLDYLPKWAPTEIWAQNGAGAVDPAIMDNGWWWGYRFFCVNYLLTYPGDPWMIMNAAIPQREDGSWPDNAVQSADWDIYPRPATPYQPNTIGICIDPMAIHNFAMDDGNPAWSDTEKANLDLAYAFGSFWCGSTESMQARADQMYANNGTLISCLNDSFPMVTGAEFDKQMDIWYSVDIHARYKDADLMPGFQEVVRLWEESQFWDISDKCYPYYVYIDGTQTPCLQEWNHITEADYVGVGVTDPAWLDTIKANLPDYNKTINERFVQAEQVLKDGLKQFYGFTDADFA